MQFLPRLALPLKLHRKIFLAQQTSPLTQLLQISCYKKGEIPPNQKNPLHNPLPRSEGNLRKAIYMSPQDNVATLLEKAEAQETVTLLSKKNTPLGELVARNTIPYGFKMAVTDIPVDTDILKYGVPIARSTRPIWQGEMVHIHNATSRRMEIPDQMKQEMLREISLADSAHKGVTNDAV